MAELLDLDAEVLHSYLSEVTAWVHDLAAGGLHQRILDLGSGTGAGALALAQRFEGAEVIAVDKSAYLLARLGGKARDLGVAGRVRAVEADLDAAWPVLGPVDLAWASSSLHHMADPDRALGEIFAAVRPGGLLAVTEIDSFPRFLAGADLGAAGSKRAATLPWPNPWPARYRIWAPTARAAEQDRLHHRGRAGRSASSSLPRCPPPPAVTLRRPCGAFGPASTAC